jgi:hypothetical protein
MAGGVPTNILMPSARPPKLSEVKSNARHRHRAKNVPTDSGQE